MRFPDIESRISSPGELSQLLQEVKRCIAVGTLRQVRPANAQFAVNDILSVPNEGPWPDYLEAYFEDPRAKRYRLTVETFHGSGGSWQPV